MPEMNAVQRSISEGMCLVLTNYATYHEYHHAETHQKQQKKAPGLPGGPGGPGQAEKRRGVARRSRLQVLLHGVCEGVRLRAVAQISAGLVNFKSVAHCDVPDLQRKR